MQSLKRRLAREDARIHPVGPIPIALVITDLDVGGAERSLVALALGLDRSRWAPSIVCLGPEAALAEPLRQAGLSVICLNCDRHRPLQAVLRLSSALRTIQPRLVQSFLFHANIAAKLASILAGRPWVIGGIRVAEREKAWHCTFERRTQRLSAGAVCVSEGVRQFSVGNGISPDRLVVIPNGVNLAAYDQAQKVSFEALGIPSGDRVALFVGRLTTQKGAGNLLQAFSKIVDKRPDWHLVIVGDGPDRVALEDQARPLGESVRFLGRREDVPSLLKTADLLVLPSLWEGMPNVVLEAMAAGRAVCVTDVEGIAELVDEQAGWIAIPGDVSDFAEKLLAATATEAPREQYGRNGRERVRKKFANEAVVSAYEQLWLGILG